MLPNSESTIDDRKTLSVRSFLISATFSVSEFFKLEAGLAASVSLNVEGR